MALRQGQPEVNISGESAGQLLVIGDRPLEPSDRLGPLAQEWMALAIYNEQAARPRKYRSDTLADPVIDDSSRIKWS